MNGRPKPYLITIRVMAGTIEILAIRHARHNDARAPRDIVDP
jgi:hypothetical protein